MNTTDFLTISSAICPDRTLMIFEDSRFTFTQLAERTNRLANAFSEMGLKKGDRVGILQVNCSQFLETYFAVAKLGAIFVPLNFRAKSDELIYMLNNSKAKILLVGSRYLDMVDKMMPDLSSVEKCISIDEKIEGKLFYDDIIESASPDDVFTEIGDDDVTVLMYTAGTTGRPKGVPLRHSGFSSYVLDNVQPADPDIAESNLLTVPLYHVAGVQAMMAAVYGGRTLVLMRQFEVKEWMKTVEKEQVTRAMLVPTMLKRVVDDPDFEKYNLTSLQILTYGAAPMPFEVIEKAIRIMPWTRFINAFGQTETASTITMLGPDDHIIEGTEEEQQKRLNR
ncbi:MAG: AMP-binding protein, partial [Spirochaetota bacterium]|nr:AMP-binding protein [Spirochaetota bacterium]